MDSSRQFDVCIIGAGLWGSAAARHLSTDTDLRVCLIGPDEPNEEEYLEAEVLGSHYDEGRISEVGDDLIWSVLQQRSVAAYRHLEDITGIPFYSEVGVLTVGPVGAEVLGSFVSSCCRVEVPYQRCGKQELQAFFPYLRHDPSKDYLFTPHRTGHISPRQLIAAQKTAAHLKGCHLINDTALEVKDILRGGRQNLLITTKRSGNIACNRVLICTGAFANFHKILPGNLKLELDVQSETIALAEVKGKELAKLSKMPAMIKYSGGYPDFDGFYLLPPIQYSDGKFYMKIGHLKSFSQRLGTLDDIKRWFASSGDEKIGEYLLRLLHDAIDFEETSVKFKGCITTETPTGHPYCGMVSPNVAVLTGGNGQGARASIEIGRMGAKLIAKGRWDYDLPEEKFRPRFKSQSIDKSKL